MRIVGRSRRGVSRSGPWYGEGRWSVRSQRKMVVKERGRVAMGDEEVRGIRWTCERVRVGRDRNGSIAG